LFTGQPVGLIVLPLMIFHQIQLLTCGWLAGQWGREAKSTPAPATAFGTWTYKAGRDSGRMKPYSPQQALRSDARPAQKRQQWSTPQELRGEMHGIQRRTVRPHRAELPGRPRDSRLV
jgi:hypothetical protein